MPWLHLVFEAWDDYQKLKREQKAKERERQLLAHEDAADLEIDDPEDPEDDQESGKKKNGKKKRKKRKHKNRKHK